MGSLFLDCNFSPTCLGNLIFNNWTFVVQVVAEYLSGEEIAGIKETFETMDVNKKGKINLEELKIGLQKLGQSVPDSDLQLLMEAVSTVTCAPSPLLRRICLPQTKLIFFVIS